VFTEFLKSFVKTHMYVYTFLYVNIKCIYKTHWFYKNTEQIVNTNIFKHMEEGNYKTHAQIL